MTPKQEERLRNKIKKIKAALAADKRSWGGYYHDGQGLRYEPPHLYLQLKDFTGGLRYMNWFNKNFPEDVGFPDFLFEWTIILFKTGRFKEAEKKAFQTFAQNTYVFDKFFDQPINPIEKNEFSRLESAEFAIDHFGYSCQQEYLLDFAAWLFTFINSEKFKTTAAKFIEIQIRLYNEENFKKRESLNREADQLEKEFC
jgi:hypothetical protein